MRTTLAILSSIAGSAIAAPQMVDRVTPEQMAERQSSTPFAALQQQQEQATADMNAKVERPGEQSLIKQSDILHDGSNWTIVPKGALLHVPAQMSARVGAKPLGTLLGWTEFLTANRAWIATEEVSFEQAAGKKPVADTKKEFWATQTKVVVAVHQGGPISVRTPQPAAPEVTRK